MPLDNKISNIIGVRLPEWVLQQLTTRSEQGSKSIKDNSNLIYTGNKSCWIRLVSSIDINDIAVLNNFKLLGADLLTTLPTDFRNPGIGSSPTLAGASGLSQQFILYGGTSIYLNNSYKQRTGLGRKGSYSPLGDNEIKKYGYRPMPGITNVSIETQGRLGSVRAATVNFKCWDKSQLDIIDALYFRLGYSMFLEWGHTYFYPSENAKIDDKTNLTPDQLASTELLFSLDPFKAGLTKEDIYLHISKNSRRSEGNYDAMLGIVTNFNFSYNQEGGYDCMIKIISLGYLADGIKINNVSGLPKILKDRIISYNALVEKIRQRDQETDLPGEPKQPISNDEFSQILGENGGIREYNNYPSSGKPLTSTQIRQGLTYEQTGRSYNVQITRGDFGEILYISRLNGFFPSNLDKYGSNINLKLSKEKLNQIIDGGSFVDINNWIEKGDTLSADVIDYSKSYTGLTPGVDYSVKFVVSRISRITDFSFIKDVLLNKPQEINESTIENIAEIGSLIKNEKLQFNAAPGETFTKPTQIFINPEYSDIISLYNDNDIRLFSYTILSEVLNSFTSQDFQLSNNIDPSDIFKPKIEITYFANPQSEGSVASITNWKFRISGTVYIRKYVKITIKNLIDTEKGTQVDREYEATLKFPFKVAFEFNDTDLIESFNTNITAFTQPENFITSQQQLLQQQQEEAANLASQQEQKSATTNQTESPLLTISGLEVILRTIQLESLSEAIINNDNNLNVGKKVNEIPLYEKKQFITNLFSVGIFSGFINDLIADDKITSFQYEKATNEERLKINSKYGFATNLMAGKEIISFFKPVDYKKLLTSYVLPYNINQTLDLGTEINHPVYITLGSLLMILNHSCTLYDENKPGVQTPMIYLDFNTEANFCLSNTQQLTTNPLKILIPIEGIDEGYKKLFSKDVLINNSIKNPDNPQGTDQTIPLFSPTNEANISGNLPKYRYGEQLAGTNYVSYRGKIMNVLLNINYIVDSIKIYSTKDEQNKVFLKPFIESILSDINKYLGNFNILRLSYNDAGNTLQIVDDQLIPPASSDESLLLPPSNINAELPLVGKKSIAKNLEVKTEISTKLSNMIAISANSPDQQSILSTNGDYFGRLNIGYVDRYIPLRKEAAVDEKSNQLNGEIRAAIQFNEAIKSFYNSLFPSEDQIGFATNYFIDKMTKLKGENPATTAAAVIPVSINFTTDGISGLGMGQSFTVSDEVLPYNYFRKIKDYDKNVGFVVVGLSHTIENNQWNTAVKSNMIFVKSITDYKEEKQIDLKRDQQLEDNIIGITERSTNVPYANLLRSTLTSLGYKEKDNEISNWGDISKDMYLLSSDLFRRIKQSNDQELRTLTIEVTGGNDEYHQLRGNRNSLHPYGDGLDFTISPYSEEIFKKIRAIVTNDMRASTLSGTSKRLSITNEYEKLSEGANGKHIHIQAI